MATDPPIRRSRRAILAAAIGVSATTIASVLGRPRPVIANHDDLHVDLGADNEATTITSIRNTTTGFTVFEAISASGIALKGSSSGSTGVFGSSSASAQAATVGSASVSTGVLGYSGPPGLPGALEKTGVYGRADEDVASRGVVGSSPTGRGGEFAGAVAQIRLTPSSADTHPPTGRKGDLFVDRRGRLWFCRGGSNWTKLAP